MSDELDHLDREGRDLLLVSYKQELAQTFDQVASRLGKTHGSCAPQKALTSIPSHKPQEIIHKSLDP